MSRYIIAGPKGQPLEVLVTQDGDWREPTESERAAIGVWLASRALEHGSQGFHYPIPGEDLDGLDCAVFTRHATIASGEAAETSYSSTEAGSPPPASPDRGTR